VGARPRPSGAARLPRVRLVSNPPVSDSEKLSWLLTGQGLDRASRVQLALTVLASVLAVSLLKQASHTSCPWDLQEFGGMAHYVSHWSWGVRDGGPGGCFPAGHASTAFAYLGGYFVLRRVAPRIALAWLAAALVGGLLLGVTQQLRGAHYMSHTLWSGWVCWTVGLAIDTVIRRARRSTDVVALQQA
jgi:membrane-associated PAP2 superfamily phosphatase